MSQPLIKIDQAGLPAGAGGASREDLVLDIEVQVTDSNNGSGTWVWTFVPPPDSLAVATGLNTNDVRFTPDVPGTYLLYVAHDTTELSYTEHLFGSELLKISSQGGAAVQGTNGERFRGDGETDQFSGWADAGIESLKKRNIIKVEGTTVSGGPFTTIDFRTVGGAGVDVTTSGIGDAIVTISGGGGGAGGGGGSLTIQEDSIDVDGGPHERLNFTGPGVEVTDDGSGGANVAIDINVPRSADVYERDATFQLDEGDGYSDHVTINRVGYAGAVTALIAETQYPVTTGNLTARLSVEGVERLTAQLDTVDDTYVVAKVDLGDILIYEGDEVTLQLTASGSYANSNTTAAGTIVTAVFANSELEYAAASGIDTIRCGLQASHDSDTPLVVGQFELDTTQFPPLSEFVFRAVAANGVTPLTSHVQLYNISDAEEVAELDFVNVTSPVMQKQALVVGPAAGNLKTESKVYEARIYVDSPGAGDTIEFGSAEIRVLTPKPVASDVDSIRLSGPESHDSATPLATIQFELRPQDYITPAFNFRAVAANGSSPLTTHVELYNLTDGESVAILDFTTMTPTLAEVNIPVGPAAGNIKNTSKIYETRIYVDSPSGPSDTIELGSAELRVSGG